MADSAAFELVAAALEKRTGWSRTQARGTLRLVLREVGLESVRLNASQAKVVTQKILPGYLRSRNVPDADEICSAIVDELGEAALPLLNLDSPEAFLERARKKR